MENAILEFGTFLGGMIVCIVHRRVSRWMVLAIGSLTGALCMSIWRICEFSGSTGSGKPLSHLPLAFHTTYFAFCWTLFFVGLSKSLSQKAQGIDEEKVKARIVAFDQLEEDDQRHHQKITDEQREEGSEIQATPTVKATVVDD